MVLKAKNKNKYVNALMKLKNNNKYNILIIINSVTILNNSFIILLILSIMIIPCFLSNQIKFRKLILNYEITIKVGGGTQTILYDTIQSPSQIFVNGNPHEVTKTLTNLNYGENNIVKMVWYSPLLDCSKMFYDLSNILEINLSNFDSSQVTNMSEMFNLCGFLTSIDFTNFNTAKVVDFKSMFYGCINLKSLDLTSFDTSSVTTMLQICFNFSGFK